MEPKKAGIPLVALIIFFALIIGIIVVCIGILLTRGTKEPNTGLKLASNDTNTGDGQNAVVNNIEEPPVEDTGTDLQLSDSKAIEAYRLAGNYDTAAKFAIYQNGPFASDNINEVLKLRLAFAQLTDEELSGDSIPKSKIEENLVKVFGTAEGVNMQTVVMFTDYNFKTDYKIISFDYNSQTETFTINKSTLNSTDPSLVREIVNKATIFNDESIEIYVTPLFIQTTDYTNEGATTKAYSLYSKYDFPNQQFTDLLIPVLKEDYYNAFVSGDELDIDKFNYESLHTNILKQNIDIATLPQYKYKFVKNGDNYNLQSFELVSSETPSTEGGTENTTSENTASDPNSTPSGNTESNEQTNANASGSGSTSN